MQRVRVSELSVEAAVELVLQSPADTQARERDTICRKKSLRD